MAKYVTSEENTKSPNPENVVISADSKAIYDGLQAAVQALMEVARSFASNRR